MDKDKLSQLIMHQEGYRSYPYDDQTGLRVKAPAGKITIGFGLNLDDGFDIGLAKIILSYQLDKIINQLTVSLAFYSALDEVRQAVLVSMAFNMGLDGLFAFKEMLGSLKAGHYPDAVTELNQSNLPKQVPRRTAELSEMLQKGEWLNIEVPV
jgi:lysozyme